MNDIGLNIDSNNSYTFECVRAEGQGNLRYIVLNNESKDYKPIKDLTNVEPSKAIKILKKMLQAIIQISSYGLDAKNLP